MKRHNFLIVGLLVVGLVGCQTATTTDTGTAGLAIEFEKYELDNGLEVVLHHDASDPIVAVALLYHVGSAREQPGRTGFAHLFEHLLFQSSENLGEGVFINAIPALGGTFNGGTSSDTTIYYESVPKDALERVLWMESDRLGFFINTVTEPRLENEKQIVKNEKRQGVDNVPYGHNNSVIDSTMFPADHPYNWQVIGSLEDLQAATLDDVREFYATYYGPQNVTLVIAGDFEDEEAKAMVERYFGEIPAGDEVPAREAPPVMLAASANLYHEDNFAQMPLLTMAWPTVEMFSADSYALDALAQLLASGKKSPFYKVVVEEKQLAPAVSARQISRELGGKFQLSARAFPGTDLDDLKASFDEAFARFENEGVNTEDLDRIKAGLETGFYNGISSVMGKAFQLSQYNTFAGDPGFVTRDLENTLAVSADDVMRVYDTYIKGHNYVATSFVPQGQVELALADARPADVFVEEIVAGAEAQVGDLSGMGEFERTPSAIDRTVAPPLGAAPSSTTRDIWTAELANGMKVLGISHDELPLIQFSIRLHGGMLLDDPAKVGVANLVTDLLMEGTANRTPEELEEAIDQLGASLNMTASSQWITVTGNTLVRNYPAVMELVEEILLEPRWDEQQFALAKERTLSNIRQSAANPNAIATRAYNRLIYGEGNILANSVSGDEASVESITIDDLKAYYAANFSPSVATVHVAGDIGRDAVVASLAGLEERWQARPVTIPEPEFPESTTNAKVYFIDVPGAPQSVFRVGSLAMSQTDPDYYPAVVMNHQLGGGITGRFFQILRIQNGYTYGAGSRFSGTSLPGPFTATTSVRANVTNESAVLIQEILADYADSYSEEDLTATKDAIIRGNFLNYETLGGLRNMLQNISAYDLPMDYVRQREQIAGNMTVPVIQELAAQYADPDKMVYLVVGDAATQMSNLEGLGYGAPILLDRDGKPVDGGQ